VGEAIQESGLGSGFRVQGSGKYKRKEGNEVRIFAQVAWASGSVGVVSFALFGAVS
jgi:hypothetical protein